MSGEPSTSKKRKLATIDRSIEEERMLSALITDVDRVKRKFEETGGVSFFEFAQIFIQLEFPTIFLGRYSIAELVEFSELILNYAASFMFSGEQTHETPSDFIVGNTALEAKKLTITRKKRSLKERVFGVYLTYALFFTQPQSHVANVKLSIKQMEELQKFCQEELLRDQCNEALFCLNRLLHAHAFMIVPFEKEFNPLLARRFNLADLTAENAEFDDPSTSNELLPGLRTMEKDYTLMQIDLAEKRYAEEKSKIKLPKGLEMVDDSLLASISAIVARTERELKAALEQ